MKETSKFKIALILNSTFAIFEFGLGFLFGSLALISDSIHNFSDSISLIIAWIGDFLSSKSATNKNTYGLKRAKILGALINSIILILVSVYIFYEAYQRFLVPSQTQGGIVVLVAFIGILVNSGIAIMFKNDIQDLNKRAAFINMALDAFASVMTLIGGVLIYFTKSNLIDPIISVMIGMILLYNSWDIIKEVLEILLEEVPRNLDPQNVKDAMLKHNCVKEVVDLHIWSLSSEYQVLTAVININSDCTGHIDNLVQDLKDDLMNQFDINHLTIESRIDAKAHED